MSQTTNAMNKKSTTTKKKKIIVIKQEKGNDAAASGSLDDWALKIAKEGVAKTRGLNRNGRHHTPRLQQTMTRAAIEAEKAGATYIGTEHVLLAILALEQGTAWRMLVAAGMTYDSTKFALRVQLCS